MASNIDYTYESKRLLSEIKENADKYIGGEKSLDEPLKKTEELYDIALSDAKNAKQVTKFLHDSTLMQVQAKLVRQRAKAYHPDTLIFNARDFSEKLKRQCLGMVSNDDSKTKLSYQQCCAIWTKLGEKSQKTMNVVPTFNFLYGTFNAEQASPVKRKHRRLEKDKIKDAVKPKTLDMSEKSEDQDVMIERANRAYVILRKILSKSEKNTVCFYEFVTDPQSFSRTIENIFLVTMLLKEGNITIFPDEQGLPYIKLQSEEEKKKARSRDPSSRVQSVLSMSVEDWQTIVKKCNFTKALLPPSKSQLKAL